MKTQAMTILAAAALAAAGSVCGGQPPCGGMAGAGPCHGAADARTERAPYLGVATSPVSPTLGRQLGLPTGVGLVVDYVDPDSPAQAVLAQHDVLHKLNEQLLVDHRQLAVLVRTMKAGSKVALRVVRGGKPLTLNAELTEREVPVFEERAWHLPPVRFDPPQISPFGPGHGQAMRNPLQTLEQALESAGLARPRVEELLERHRTRLREFEEKTLGQWQEALEKEGLASNRWQSVLEELEHPLALPAPIRPNSRYLVRQYVGPGGGPQLSAGSGGGRSVVTLIDKDHRLTLRGDPNEGTWFTAEKTNGELLFEGRVETDAQRGKIPVELRDKFEQLRKMGGEAPIQAPRGGPDQEDVL